MSKLWKDFRIFAGQMRYQLRLLLRTPMAAFATIVIPLMVLLAVGLLYRGSHIGSRGDIAYIQFFDPAMIAFATVTACYMSVVSTTVVSREQGILKRLRSTPLPPWLYLAAKVATVALVAFVSSVTVIAVGAGVYGFHLNWGAVPAALLVWVIAVVSFSALGLAVTTLVPRAEAALPVAWGSMLPLCFVSDVFQPIDGAPEWLRAVASSLPLRPFADELESLLGPRGAPVALNSRHLEVLALWGVVAIVFALASFRWQPSGQRRGLIRRAPLTPRPFSPERLAALLRREKPDAPSRPARHGGWPGFGRRTG
jgi:ABC-2 type transport system permease protein